MKNPLKNKNYITFLIFGLIILSLVLFLVLPLLTEIKNGSKNLLSKKNNTAVLQAQSNEIENFKKEYRNYKTNLEIMDQLFIDPQNPVDFIKFLENTANDTGIKIEISLAPISQQKNEKFITLQLFSSDNFIKIMNFTEKLENGPYLVEIKNVAIKKQPPKTPSNLASEQVETNDGAPSEEVDANFSINIFTKQ
ncbi:MAG: hypothetical protein A2908_03285 [Candidatus Staskawiczbacteria bacterium RIFCSPLOWO2_01_FULL_38_12b]|uniref:Uncharacterized protein n=1 Tax=Candidatus Staskawiczbacteria bacterium RIFCSPLOWO2_01_FULL_38_12b TaxID=1802214 RepID=A0A1G2ICF9_9BACT|nr:MAG: hypothetical protein A2908_03285 [Candidatus Staskawiczbacteria bacterium RIFCSPLOWO2_01_FULL_38_12b]